MKEHVALPQIPLCLLFLLHVKVLLAVWQRANVTMFEVGGKFVWLETDIESTQLMIG